MNEELFSLLACPRDRAALVAHGAAQLVCSNGHVYPVWEGVPILLRDDVPVTHASHARTLESARTGETTPLKPGTEEGVVDPYVQEAIAATCGRMYIPLINRLKSYPIPELRLPPGDGKRLLDIGCNWGRWCVSAARKGYRPVGIDPSLEAILAARRVARSLGVEADYIVADARSLPFPPRVFDVIFSFSVLQHFQKSDARAALDEISRVLRPGGHSFIQMPNRFGPANLLHQLRRIPRRRNLFDVRYWSPKELLHVFGKAIGPSRLSVDSFFCLNAQPGDRKLLSPTFRLLITLSEGLRSLSGQATWLTYLADSVYVSSQRLSRDAGRLTP